MPRVETAEIKRPEPRTIARAAPGDATKTNDAFHELRDRWFRALRAANRSPETIDSYGNITNDLYRFLAREGHSTDPEYISRESVERYFDWLRTRDKPVRPATIAIRFRSLAAMFRWASRDDDAHIPYLRKNPMLYMKRPRVPEDPPPVLTDASIAKLLETCRGRSFEDRRDRAIFLMFRWTGMRLGELVGLRYDTDTMDLNARRARITGKTGTRFAKWAPEAATALDTYLFSREQHLDAHLPELWLGRRGPMTKHAVSQMFRRRALKAGLRVTPHQFRHTFASNWMEDRQGDEQNLIAALGWSSGAMLRRYGAADRQRRALDAYDEWAETRTKKRTRSRS